MPSAIRHCSERTATSPYIAFGSDGASAPPRQAQPVLVGMELAFSADCGFVRAVTGLEAPNGTFLQVDPVRSDPGSEQISAFPRVELRWTPLLWLRNPC
jgi:hypothetical protein